MNIQRIFGVVCRYIFSYKGSANKVISLVYWPMIDVAIWGFNSRWISQMNSQDNLIFSILTSLSFWIVVYVTTTEVSRTITEEIYSHNLVNLFSTPLKKIEWICAVMIVGFISSAIAFMFSVFFIWLLYGINVLSIGLLTIPFFLYVLFCGYILAIFASGFLIYFGTNIDALPWMMGWAFLPFSGVFFSLSVLPAWVQKFCLLIPTSYFFEPMRNFINGDISASNKIIFGGGVTLGLFVLSVLFFIWMYEKSRNYGLARLE